MLSTKVRREATLVVDEGVRYLHRRIEESELLCLLCNVRHCSHGGRYRCLQAIQTARRHGHHDTPDRRLSPTPGDIHLAKPAVQCGRKQVLCGGGNSESDYRGTDGHLEDTDWPIRCTWQQIWQVELDDCYGVRHRPVPSANR